MSEQGDKNKLLSQDAKRQNVPLRYAVMKKVNIDIKKSGDKFVSHEDFYC